MVQTARNDRERCRKRPHIGIILHPRRVVGKFMVILRIAMVVHVVNRNREVRVRNKCDVRSLICSEVSDKKAEDIIISHIHKFRIFLRGEHIIEGHHIGSGHEVKFQNRRIIQGQIIHKRLQFRTVHKVSHGF